MPYVLLFNRPAVEGRLTALARYLDLPDPSFAAVLNWVLSLRKELEIPNDLSALGVTDDHVGQLADMAVADPSAGGNPVELTVENLTDLFADAIHGRLDN